MTGSLVAYCIEHGRTLEDLPLETYRAFHSLFDEDLYEAISGTLRKRP